jgi:hypothetical protein
MATERVLHEGLSPLNPDPESGRKGRLLARILLAISIAATAWVAWRRLNGESSDREDLRPLLFLLGIDAFLCISFLAPPKGTGGFRAHPRARWGVTAIGLFIAVLGAIFFALTPGLGTGGVWRGDVLLLCVGGAVIAMAWKRPRGVRGGLRRR